jgi:putative DNA primase/helicase
MKEISSIDFLSAIWPSTLLRNESFELRAIRRRDKSTSRRFLKSQSEFLSLAKNYGAEWDIYYGVCTRYEEGGTKKDCYRIGCVWVDFDNISALPNFGKAQPDIIVSSGGGYHVYWILETPKFVRDGRWIEIEAINRGLAKKLNTGLQPVDKTKKFGADMQTIDVTRILRVPGFFNYKYNPPKKVIANAVHD